MKNLIILSFLLSSIVQAQTFTIFENNKKNKALFDYSDPNSLVSLLLQNKDKIKDISCKSLQDEYIGSSISGITGTTMNEESIHPIEGSSSFSCPAGYWDIPNPNYPGQMIHLIKGKNQTFKDWIDSLTIVTPTSWVEVQDINPTLTVYDELSIFMLDEKLKIALENQYNLTKPEYFLKRPDIIKYLDLDQINLIILDSTNIIFCSKSSYENKHFISLILSMEELNKFERIDFLNKDISKSIIQKLREFQLKKRDNDEMTNYIEPDPSFDISEYWTQSDLFNVHDEKEFKTYKKTSCIKNLIPGRIWTIRDPNNPGNELVLRKESDMSFQKWVDSLTIVTPTSLVQVQDNNPNFSVYEEITIWNFSPENKAILKEQYDKALVGQPLKHPDFEAIYWVDYPDPAVYLKRRFWKDTLGNFNTSFSQLLFTERLENKRGYSQKPQVLMSFGESDEYEYGSISPEILDLLKPEFIPFNLKQEFAWQKLISNRKGKLISSEELKKLIHCFEIDENGIQY